VPSTQSSIFQADARLLGPQLLIMKALLLVALIAICAASGLHAAGTPAGTPRSKRRPRPQCTATFAVRRTKQGTSQRVKLPMCSAAPRATQPAGTVLAAAAAASPVPATAYPCNVGDATCYCQNRQAVGFFADNDPTVGCG
jgi:hypothetical protein